MNLKRFARWHFSQLWNCRSLEGHTHLEENYQGETKWLQKHELLRPKNTESEDTMLLSWIQQWYKACMTPPPNKNQNRLWTWDDVSLSISRILPAFQRCFLGETGGLGLSTGSPGDELGLGGQVLLGTRFLGLLGIFGACHKWGYPKNRCFIREKNIGMDDLGVPLF